ncbi:NUDIX domain-containing protein [Demequina zhanjiangensis]|uniref:NUDIX hydrolase n=1 Tax=Demequina zhanjiangensis TaxID=3051659 RepID=A0ABT8G301_9MICO|nr:NUDIX hydrolase [Demequina sp. SYSU T00b26]MDN4473074.1 NUDIX hydrolase [Demequina sp. SYSU T00b26]
MADDGPLVDVPGPRPVLATHERFHGKVWDVASDEVDLGESGVVTRDYLRHTGAVVIVAMDAQERVYLVRQYRHPVGTECWEPPAGLLDMAGESPVDAARRELAEETDLTAETWHTLVDYFPSGGGTSEAVRVFLARGIGEVPEDERHVREAEERDMIGAWVSLDDAVEAVLDGRVHASSAVAGLLAADRARRDGFASLRAADAPWMRPEATRLVR